MPSRRFKRKRNFRRFKFSKKRIIKRFLRKRRNTGNPTFVKLRNTLALTADAGGVLNSQILTRDPSSGQEWSNFTALYDLYKVCAIRVQFFPELFNEVHATDVFKPLYIVVDTDNTSNPLATVNAAIQYDNCQVKNLYRPFTLYHKVPPITSATGAVGSTSVYKGGWADAATAVPNGMIAWYGNGFTANAQYGTLVVTRYVGFRNRR